MIRALWHGRIQRASGNEAAAGPSAPPAQMDRPAAGESLQSRLAARIASVDVGNATRMRETFVETVLLWELGEQLAQDPAFGEMVTRVSQQLALDAGIRERLHRLLLRLSGASRAAGHP